MRSAPSPVKAAVLGLFIITASVRPAGGQIPPPRFSKHSLLNGFEILILPEPAERVQFALMVKNGAAFDPVEKWGATYLMARLMSEATERRTSEQLRLDLKTLGAEIQFRVDWDALFWYGSAPVDRIEDILNVLSDIVVRPRFEPESFERLRAELVEEVQRESDSPERLTQKLFLSSLFQQNPYAHTIKGEPETLNNLHLNDLKIQYRKLIMPNQAQLALYFPGDQTRLLRSLARRWGSWVRGDPAPFTFRRALPPQSARILLVDRPGEESLIRFGALGPRRGEADYYPLKVLEQYLTLRLTDWAAEISSRSQIQASVEVAARRMPGFVQFNVKADDSQIVPYLNRIRSALAELRDGKIEADRFREAKELAFLQLRDGLAAPRSRLFELLEANLHDLGVSYIAAYGLRLDRVRPDQVKQVVQQLFPEDAFVAVVAGSAQRLAPKLERLASVEILN